MIWSEKCHSLGIKRIEQIRGHFKPFCGHSCALFGNNRFIDEKIIVNLFNYFADNSNIDPKIRHHFYHPFESTVKNERRNNRTIQTASASFHENTITKVPIAVIPRAGRSQQRSQTKPEVSRNEIARDSRIKRTNILFSPFILCVYYTIGVGLCQALFSKSSESFSIMFTAVGSMVSPKCQPFRTFSLSSIKMDTS